MSIIDKEELREHILHMGVDLVGFTSAEPFDQYPRRVHQRIADGRIPSSSLNDERCFRDPERWSDPRSSLGSAVTVIVLGVGYLLSDDGADPGRASISRFFWKDFRGYLDLKVEQTIGHLREMGFAAERAHIPVKMAAHRSGMAVYGKNTIAQNLEFGSWIVLRAIVTDALLPPDEEGEQRCGSCQKCQRLCPTKALTPFELDIGRCINHLLASTEPIPIEHREAIGTMISGCDICQEVCPRNGWTRKPERDHPEWNADWRRWPELLPLLDITEERFERDFAMMEWHSPHPRYLKRNALVALGNVRDERAMKRIAVMLSDPDPLLRGHAAWALGRYSAPEAREALVKALRSEKDETVVKEIGLALDM